MSSNRLPWSSEYNVFGIPKTFKPYPDEPVYSILEMAAKKYSKMGFVQMNFLMTYPQIKEHVDRLATAFNSMGIKKGDRIATLLPTSIQFVIVDYAISRCGAVHIPSSSLEPFSTLEYKFNEAKPKALVCLCEFLDVALKLKKEVNIEHLILTLIDDYSHNSPNLHEVLNDTLWLRDLISEFPPKPPKIEYDVENDLETLLFTGGTTGLPKGCMLTHRNIYANAIQSGRAMGSATQLLRGAIAVLLGVPFFHSYGHCVMHGMTLLGAKQLLVTDARNTKDMVDMIKKYRPMLQVGVPTQFMKLLSEELKDIGILGVSGSAALPPKTQEEFEKHGGGGIMEGYGLSEMSPATHINNSMILRIFGGRTNVKISNQFLKIPGVIPVLNRFIRLFPSEKIGEIVHRVLPKLMKSSGKKASKRDQEKRGTIGIPMPDTEIKILDVDSGKPLTIEELINGDKSGEMCLNGPQRMLGYWPDAYSGMDEEGFVHTGDVVRIDDRGYFFIVDRTKDMIIVSGYKVYSRELDDYLYKHSAVQMAATVGIPDPDREGSERVVVYIELKPEYRGKIKEDEIIEFLRGKVAKYAVPKHIKFIDSMPLTEVQKVNKKYIRELAVKEIKLT